MIPVEATLSVAITAYATPHVVLLAVPIVLLCRILYNKRNDAYRKFTLERN